MWKWYIFFLKKNYHGLHSGYANGNMGSVHGDIWYCTWYNGIVHGDIAISHGISVFYMAILVFTCNIGSVHGDIVIMINCHYIVQPQF